MTDLFSTLDMGDLSLGHRVIMAPLTRMRAVAPAYAPTDMMVEYYSQRANPGGMIITEATLISQSARGAPDTPGIYTPEQVDGWRRVAEAIHARGGIGVMQLWHMGRLSHPSYQPDGGAPFAPSPVRADVDVVLPDRRREPCPMPRQIETADIPALIETYVSAARSAVAAGFDGVEIHAANGYLLEQFLQSRSNRRTDAYGGSIEARCRIVIEIARAIASAVGAARVGIRLSPFGIANDSGEDDPFPLYAHLIGELDRLGLAYLHLIEPRASGAGQKDVDHQDVPSAARLYRPIWNGALVAAGNFNGESARAMIAEGVADAIAFGRYFISNPDLPERLRLGAGLTPYNRPTFYTPGAEGYTDYPRLGTT
ncbi:alkene reductase [Tropicimonas sediminicola]|uniref:N-ethylmaleimide reductase n=1 Tax=Tropicimonas sediminicola TaxID=1031541 RepID=A0A239LBC7_9RHOB|nr:alkene reductase [Tropicimonas sediminicola]SNT27946.1 N-ethylmaleimide reductase [Tropicimonas sediminicola]